MQICHKRPVRRKQIFICRHGFPRRLPWTRPFTVRIYKLAVSA